MSEASNVKREMYLVFSGESVKNIRLALQAFFRVNRKTRNAKSFGVHQKAGIDR